MGLAWRLRYCVTGQWLTGWGWKTWWTWSAEQVSGTNPSAAANARIEKETEGWA